MQYEKNAEAEFNFFFLNSQRIGLLLWSCLYQKALYLNSPNYSELYLGALELILEHRCTSLALN